MSWLKWCVKTPHEFYIIQFNTQTLPKTSRTASYIKIMNFSLTVSQNWQFMQESNMSDISKTTHRKTTRFYQRTASLTNRNCIQIVYKYATTNEQVCVKDTHLFCVYSTEWISFVEILSVKENSFCEILITRHYHGKVISNLRRAKCLSARWHI